MRPGLLRVALACAEAVEAQVGRPEAAHGHAVHSARLALKRLRALLRLLRPALAAELVEAESARLRLAAGALAPSRDAAVALTTLAALADECPAEDARLVLDVRAALATAMHDPARGGPAMHGALLGAAEAATATAQALSAAPWRLTGWSLVAAGLKASHRRARRRLQTARRAGPRAVDDDAFHSWRASVKALLYQLQFLRAALPRPRRALLEGLDRLQERLGDEHDLAMVCESLARHAAALGPAEDVSRVVRLANWRRESLRRGALERGRRLLDRSTGSFVTRVRKGWRRWRRRGAGGVNAPGGTPKPD